MGGTEYDWWCLAAAEYSDLYNIHHIVPIEDGGDAFSHDNLTLLCVDCHRKEHSISLMQVAERLLRTKSEILNRSRIKEY